MTNAELLSKLHLLVRNERKITQEIMELIQEAEKRGLHLEQGPSNLYIWLEKEFGYSRGSAHRRIQGARLLKQMPEVQEKLEDGILNISVLSQVQSAFQKEERKSGERIPLAEKRDLVKQLEGKSSDEAKRVLAKTFPELKKRDVERAINEEETRVSVTLKKEDMENLQRAKELLSHTLPNASAADVLSYALAMLVKQKAPEKKSAANARRVTNPKKLAKLRAGGKCEFKSDTTGKVCGSKYQVEVDHIVPRALGGTDAQENLRCLCKQHNLFEAERKLGKEFMSQYRMRP